MSKGAGFAPAGFSPAGFGAPDAAPVTQTVPFPDPLTGKAQTGALINYQTGDYVMTADGRVAGMGSMQQLVLLALLNAQIFKGLETKGPNFQRQVASRVTAALAYLLRQKWIAVASVTVSGGNPSSPDAAGVVVNWRDLTMAQSGTVATKTPNTFQTTVPTA